MYPGWHVLGKKKYVDLRAIYLHILYDLLQVQANLFITYYDRKKGNRSSILQVLNALIAYKVVC